MPGFPMRTHSLLAIVAGLLIASAAPAQEWPRFRGPNGSGVSATVLPTRWTDKDYRWQVKLPGPGDVPGGKRAAVNRLARGVEVHQQMRLVGIEWRMAFLGYADTQRLFEERS
jgi:hypothetical protein